MPDINPSTTSLCHGNAYWMARLSQAVYREVSDKDTSPDCETILRDLKNEDEKFIGVSGFNENSAQAIFVEHQDYVCMAFRGTDEILDWLDNLNGFQTDELFGGFHRGFWYSTKDVWELKNGKPGIWNIYKDSNVSSKKPLFITGHSLGGAMATIAAAWFVHWDLPFNCAYTFGQPRVMSREASRIFNAECGSRFFRFHNNNDLVTRIPARLMGYSHVGKYYYISDKETIHPEPNRWYKFLDCVEASLKDIGELGFDGIKDHKIEKYVNAMKKWDFNKS